MIITYQTLFTALTFSLFLMVNRRLLAEGVTNLTERQRTEAALRSGVEKFSKAFHASPDAILISRLADGRIVEVNEGFCRLLEFSRQEALDSSLLALNLWADPQERDRWIAALRESKSVRDYETDFCPKSGKRLHCLMSAEIIYLGDQAHILLILRDISEHKQAEENLELETVRLQAQLALHKMMDAPQSQLLDFTLEAIIKATQSRYGFIGLMDQAEEVVTVYAWSKNTMQECEIESNSMDFPLCEAGLWGECVRQRKPIIVNAYDDYPDKKGFPAGHVPIERFLSVPIFDGERIVVIAAAANKAGDYVESDSIALTLLVERLWGILRRKRAEEALRESEAQARRLAEENAQLLREINHRVGNNLYLLSILVKNQLEQTRETETRNVLLDLSNRLRSMSSIHKLLQGSNWHPIELELLASRVVHGVVQSMAIDKPIEVVVAPCEESVLVGAKQAFKLALALNELATNSIKYAFSGQEDGRIEIKVGKESDGAPIGRLEYRDNGRGWPEDVLSGEREGTGLYLVRSTIEYEMEGQVVLRNDGGAVMSCKFNLDQAY